MNYQTYNDWEKIGKSVNWILKLNLNNILMKSHDTIVLSNRYIQFYNTVFLIKSLVQTQTYNDRQTTHNNFDMYVFGPNNMYNTVGKKLKSLHL